MSIRLIAKDLYRLKQEVQRLERELEKTPYELQADLKDQLRRKRAERDRMQGILNGAKEPPSVRNAR